MKKFSNFLTEIKISLQYHDELNPSLWSGGKLDSEVRLKLITFAETWADFANIPKNLIKDIIFTGGNANYNYTKKSDIDVHLVIDRSKIGDDKKLVDEYLQDKKVLWSLTHNVRIRGYPIEPYAQDLTLEYPKNQGVYSLKRNKWIQKPVHGDYDFQNDHLLKQKVSHYIKVINHVINSKMSLNHVESLKARFKEMRNSAIHKGGEFSTENLVFKELRNRGLLDKMNKYQTDFEDQELSLK